MKIPWSRFGALTLLLGLTSCGGGSQAESIPRVDMTEMDEALAARLNAAIRAVEEDPSSAQRWFDLARYYDANELWESAASAYGELVRRDGHEYRAKSTYHLGRMREHLGRLEEALVSFAAAEHLSAGYLPTIWRQGEVLASLGRLEEARDAFLRALGRRADDSASLLGLARVQLSLGEPQAALDTLLKLVEHHPQIRFAHNLMVRAYGQLGRPGRARRSAAREKRSGDAAYRDPWLGEVRTHRVGQVVLLEEGHAALAGGDARTALAIVEPLHREHPESFAALRLLLQALNHERRFDETLGALDAAGELHTEHHLLLIPEGRALVGTERHAEAVLRFRRAIELAPGYAAGRIALGEVLLILGRNEEAAEALEAARALDEMSVRDWLLLARATSTLRRHGQTIRHMRKALEDYPVSPDLWMRLAEALVHVGRLEEAREALAKVERHAPNHDDLARVRERISEAQTDGE